MQSNLAKVSPYTQMGHQGRCVLLLANPNDIKSKAYNSTKPISISTYISSLHIIKLVYLIRKNHPSHSSIQTDIHFLVWLRHHSSNNLHTLEWNT